MSLAWAPIRLIVGAGWEVGDVFLLEKITRFAQTSFFLQESPSNPLSCLI